MAIALDNTGVGATAIGVSSISWNHTVNATDANTVIVVGCGFYSSNVSAATYNAVALTSAIREPASGSGQGLAAAQQFYQYNPAAGTHSVSLTFSANSWGHCNSISLSGVKTGGPDATGTLGSASTSSPSIPVTTVTDQDWLVGWFQNDTANVTFTASGDTLISQGSGGGAAGAGFYKGPVAVGSNAVACTISAAVSIESCATAWAPVAGGGAVSGTAALTAAAASLSSSGSEVFSGTAALTASAAGVASSGTEEFPGTSAVTGSTAGYAGTGAETFSGTAAVAAAPASMAAEGASGLQPVTGTVAVAAATATVSASGTLLFSATSAVSAGPASLAGSGAHVFSGSGAVSAGVATLAASGTHTPQAITGTSALAALVASIVAVGANGATGRGSVVASDAGLGSATGSDAGLGSATGSDAP